MAALPEELQKCPACKKNVQRAKWYYRNGKYFCNQNCWRKMKQKPAEEQSG